MKVQSIVEEAEVEETEEGWSTVEVEVTDEEKVAIFELGIQVLFLTNAYGIGYKDLVNLCKERYGDPEPIEDPASQSNQ